ncbi:mCG1050971 [Mus musculus]|nr:mCG1050971 [Mus musculus]
MCTHAHISGKEGRDVYGPRSGRKPFCTHYITGHISRDVWL